MRIKHSSSLTVTGKGRLNVLKSPLSVCPFDPAHPRGTPHPSKCDFTGIWDTGATNSVITQKVVQSCGLQPTGMTNTHGVHGTRRVSTYLVDIHMPNGVAFEAIQVTEGILSPDADVLIGMDIITIGDFVITNRDGITVFSFRVPSTARFDFVKEHNADRFKGAPRLPPSKNKRGGKRRK